MKTPQLYPNQSTPQSPLTRDCEKQSENNTKEINPIPKSHSSPLMIGLQNEDLRNLILANLFDREVRQSRIDLINLFSLGLCTQDLYQKILNYTRILSSTYRQDTTSFKKYCLNIKNPANGINILMIKGDFTENGMYKYHYLIELEIVFQNWFTQYFNASLNVNNETNSLYPTIETLSIILKIKKAYCLLSTILSTLQTALLAAQTDSPWEKTARPLYVLEKLLPNIQHLAKNIFSEKSIFKEQLTSIIKEIERLYHHNEWFVTKNALGTIVQFANSGFLEKVATKERKKIIKNVLLTARILLNQQNNERTIHALWIIASLRKSGLLKNSSLKFAKELSDQKKINNNFLISIIFILSLTTLFILFSTFLYKNPFIK